MEFLSQLKKGFLPFLLLFLPLHIFADFIYNDDQILMEKSVGIMNIIGKELHEKTGVSLYVAATKSLNGQDIKEYEKSLRSSYKDPYIAIIVSTEDQKLDIIESESIKPFFDKKRVYWDFIIPLLPKKEEHMTPQRYSAAILNGHTDIVDQLSQHYNVKLDSALPSDHNEINTYVQYVFAFMAITFLGALVYSRMRKK